MSTSFPDVVLPMVIPVSFGRARKYFRWAYGNGAKSKDGQPSGHDPEGAAAELRNEIWKSFHTTGYEEGLKIGHEVIARFKNRFPAAMACMEEDRRPACNV
jgi:hypothetical protein